MLVKLHYETVPTAWWRHFSVHQFVTLGL